MQGFKKKFFSLSYTKKDQFERIVQKHAYFRSNSQFGASVTYKQHNYERNLKENLNGGKVNKNDQCQNCFYNFNIHIGQKLFLYLFFLIQIQYTGHSVTHVEQFDFNQNKRIRKLFSDLCRVSYSLFDILFYFLTRFNVVSLILFFKIFEKKKSNLIYTYL